MASGGPCHLCLVGRAIAFDHASQQPVCASCLLSSLQTTKTTTHVVGTNFDIIDDLTPVDLNGVPLPLEPVTNEHSVALPNNLHEFLAMPRLNFDWQETTALLRPLYLLRSQGQLGHYQVAIAQTVEGIRAVMRSRPRSYELGAWRDFCNAFAEVVYATATERVQAYVAVARQRASGAVHCEDQVLNDYVNKNIPVLQQRLETLVAEAGGLLPLDRLATQLVAMYEFVRQATLGSWDVPMQQFIEQVNALATALTYWSVDDHATMVMALFSMVGNDLLGQRTETLLRADAEHAGLPSLAQAAATNTVNRRFVGVKNGFFSDAMVEFRFLGWGIVTREESLRVDNHYRVFYETTQERPRARTVAEFEADERLAFNALWERSRDYSSSSLRFEGSQGGCVVQGPVQPFVWLYTTGTSELTDTIERETLRADWSRFATQLLHKMQMLLPADFGGGLPLPLPSLPSNVRDKMVGVQNGSYSDTLFVYRRTSGTTEEILRLDDAYRVFYWSSNRLAGGRQPYVMANLDAQEHATMDELWAFYNRYARLELASKATDIDVEYKGDPNTRLSLSVFTTGKQKRDDDLFIAMAKVKWGAFGNELVDKMRAFLPAK